MSYGSFFWHNKIQRRLFPKAYKRWWDKTFNEALKQTYIAEMKGK